ncbi:MAG: hypothetical protein OEV06_09095, partial [Anaerolineae bacterium]|nr:hypothetical protein [Anaerolineae bacterium]
MASKQDRLTDLLAALHASSPAGWDDLASTLTRIKEQAAVNSVASPEAIFPSAANGTAFLTFEYGLDGVSVEIAKYARALESALQDFSPAPFHLIGGDFHPHSDRLFNPDMPRYRLPSANGWSKWDGGKWFSALFYKDMPENNEGSNALANEIFSQALSIADSLGNYILNNNISLLIPVNIASNPGNIALTLALVLVSEALGLAVINSNHDFYWEGGRPADQRAPGAPPGVRDHFFRNMANRPFFDLFRSLYPWNGKHWLQVNINSRQSTRLVERFSFPPG